MSILEKLKALDDQRAKIVDDAKQNALDKAHQALAELKELGFTYSLAEEHRSASVKPAGSSKTKAKRHKKDGPCSICHFATSPTHDGRSHRDQEPRRPFTSVELADKGLAKISEKA